MLRNEEAQILRGEHNQILRSVPSQTLKPSKHSLGRILASTPIMDPTLKSGISSRLLRVRISREADVIEFKIGDIIVDAKSPLPEGEMLILGNGVLEIRTVNDEPGEGPLIIGCKSSRWAWALTAYEEIICRDAQTGMYDHRSGVTAIVKANMSGFIIPRSLADAIFSGDHKEKEYVDSIRRAAVNMLIDTSLRRALSAAVEKATWIEGGLLKFTTFRFATRGFFQSVVDGGIYPLDLDSIVILLRGIVRIEGMGMLIAPAVLDSRSRPIEAL